MRLSLNPDGIFVLVLALSPRLLIEEVDAFVLGELSYLTYHVDNVQMIGKSAPLFHSNATLLRDTKSPRVVHLHLSGASRSRHCQLGCI